MKDRFDEVNGVRLHSLEAGPESGEIIIFLHGFPEYSGAWNQQLDFMAKNGYHALAPDQRGYNLSSKPGGVKSYLINTLVADIAALITRLTNQKVILVGHDWGGGIAWELATQHPDKVKQLVIINMPHLAVMKQALKTNPRQMLKSWYAAFFQFPLLPELLCRSFNFSFLARAMSGTANKDTFSKEDFRNYKQVWQQPGALTTMINWYRAFKYHTISNAPIIVPALMIWGKNDKTLNASMARPSIAKCTNGKLVIIDDATHWVYHEKPDEVNSQILNFVKGFNT